MNTILCCIAIGFGLNNNTVVEGEYVGTRNDGQIVLIKYEDEIREYKLSNFSIEAKKEFVKLNRLDKAKKDKAEKERLKLEKIKKEQEELARLTKESQDKFKKLYPEEDGILQWNMKILQQVEKVINESKDKEQFNKAFHFLNKMVVAYASNDKFYPEMEFLMIKRDGLDVYIHTLFESPIKDLQIKSYNPGDNGKIRNWQDIYLMLEKQYAK